MDWGFSLFNLIYCLYSSFFILEIIKTFFDIRTKMKNYIIYLFLTMLILFPFAYLPNNLAIIRFISPLCIYIIFNILILRVHYISSIIVTLFYFIILFLSDLMTATVLELIFGKGISIRENIIINSAYYIITFGISFFILLVLKYVKQKNNNITIKTKKLALIITYLFVTLIYMIANLYFYEKYTSLVDGNIFVINSIVIIIYFVLTVFSLYNSQQLFYYTEENLSLNSYIKTINQLHDELRRFRHNYSNIIIGLKGYADKKDIEGINNYIDELIQKNQNIKNIDAFDFSKISNPALKSLLLSKISMALDKNIKVIFEYNFDIENINISISDLCEVLGVFLDNAIEECEKLKISDRRIEIFIDSQSDICIIVIANPYKEKPNINKVSKKGYTTKEGKNRGIGLYSARNILSSYHNVILNTVVETNSFIQELQIKIK